MKKFLPLILFLLAGCAGERTVILLSTNDMHAQIQHFPRLATAVQACRDTAQVILIDAGDRWTGSAYVDRAPGRLPVIELMNRLKYDVATLGNHEFDAGQQVLADAVAACDFPVICANMIPENSPIPQLEPYAVVKRAGAKFAFVGVVTTYPKGYPDGHEEVFAGLRFDDPVEALGRYESLRNRCGVLTALTHFGTQYDTIVAQTMPAYDLVIGGHTHEQIDTLIGGVLVTQTGRNLKNIGVTTLRLRGRKVVHKSFRLIPLEGYEPDPAFRAMVDTFLDNPELKLQAADFAATAGKTGIANLFLQAIRHKTGSDVVFYHRGGMRRDSLVRGVVTRADVYDLDPFISSVVTMTMTPEQMRQMIETKYNDTKNEKESHMLDIYSTTPYTIHTDGHDAVDVTFPELREGQGYTVAMGDYIFKEYEGLDYTGGQVTRLEIPDLLMEQVANGGRPYTPDNTLRQREEVRD